MSKNREEQLSHLMDGEFDDDAGLLAAMKQDPELKARWERYHLIRDAMGNHLSEHFTVSIADQVAEQLEQEPTILAPPRRRFFNKDKLLKPAAGFAIAATIATVAIISVQAPQLVEQRVAQQDGGQNIATIDVQSQPNVATLANSRLSAERRKHLRAVDSKLSGYLVKHNEHSVSARMQGAIPYMRIVGDTVGQRTKHDQ